MQSQNQNQKQVNPQVQPKLKTQNSKPVMIPITQSDPQLPILSNEDLSNFDGGDDFTENLIVGKIKETIDDEGFRTKVRRPSSRSDPTIRTRSLSPRKALPANPRQQKIDFFSSNRKKQGSTAHQAVADWSLC